MSAAEIFILVLMAIIGLQMWVFYSFLKSSLETMRSCSETSDKAYELAMRVLDEQVAESPALRALEDEA